MKNLIAASIIVLASATSAFAGEAYVRNTDTYSRETTRSRVNFYGRENYNGVSRDYSSANKVRKEYGRGDFSFASTRSVSTDYTRYNGFDAYRGVETGYGVTTEYSHEVAGGTR